MSALFFMQLKLYFNIHAVFSDSCLNFFEIFTVEELSQPTKHANKILVSIYLTVKATILDTHRNIYSHSIQIGAKVLFEECGKDLDRIKQDY